MFLFLPVDIEVRTFAI